CASSNSRSVVANIDSRITVKAMTKNQTERVVLIRSGVSLQLWNLDQGKWRIASLSGSNSDGGYKRPAPIFARLFSKLIQTSRTRARLHQSPKTGSQSRRSANARQGKFSSNQQLRRRPNRASHVADKKASDILRRSCCS